MNLDNLAKCALRQHKATLAVAQQLTGIPFPLLHSLPVVVKSGRNIWCYSPTQAAGDSDYINPYIMNGSFSLELHMKYLHALETGEPMRNIHNLKEIFGLLTEESRTSIRNHFAAVVQASATSKQVARIVNEFTKLQFRWDIDFLLEKSNMAFERWRYIYEDKQDSTWFAGYSEIRAALQSRIKEVGGAI